jgi:hypothetical protein
MGWLDETRERRDISGFPNREPGIVRALAQISSNGDTENHGTLSKVPCP